MATAKDRYRRYRVKVVRHDAQRDRARSRGTTVPLHVLAKMTDEEARAYVLRRKGDQP